MPITGHSDVAALVAQAQQAFAHGQSNQARALVATGLQRAPADVELLTLRGALAQQVGDRDQARRDFERVVALDPGNEAARLNLGIVLADSGRLAEARDELEQAVHLAAPSAAAWSGLGRVRWRLGDAAGAREAFDEALGLEPRVASRHHDRAVLRSAAGDHVAALQDFTRACVLDPGAWRSQLGMAQEWAALGNLAAADRCWRAVAEREAQRPEVWSAWAAGLVAQKSPTEALPVCGAGLARHPDYARLWLVRAAAERDLDQPDAADVSWSEAAGRGREPFSAADWSLGGKIAWDRGDFGQAASRLERAVVAEPHEVEYHVNLAGAWLIQGDFARGWPEYAWRTRAPGFTPDPAACPELPWWDGALRGGRHLWVHAEQGLGDELMFATCLDDLLAEPGRVIWTCDQRLVGLMRRSFPAVDVRPRSQRPDPSSSTEPAFQVLAGSLPGIFRRRFEDFPRRAGWLTPDEALVARWRERLAQLPPGLKVGVSWRGGLGGREQRLRSLPLARWQPLLARAGVVPISLQYGETAAEIHAAAAAGLDVRTLAELDPLADLEGLAALIAALDLVISVPNATVHLAGAVGTATWALVRHAPDWRWFATGEECPWYGSVRLLRQPAPGDWSSVLARAGKLLNERLAEHREFAPRQSDPVAGGLTRTTSPTMPPVVWVPATEPELGQSTIERL